MASVLLRLGEVMLQHGDVLSARAVFERAAADGSGQGATDVGKTYDPHFLATIVAPGLKSDVTLAIRWYRRASTVLGDREAGERLKALTARTGQGMGSSTRSRTDVHPPSAFALRKAQ
jgi:hypothetical protein